LTEVVSDRRRLAAILVLLALVAGLLTWAVVPTANPRCLWAVTIGTDRQGYMEVPCDATIEERWRYRNHPDAKLIDEEPN